MEGFDLGVTSDSPAGTDLQGGAPSAETLNTGQPASPAEHTIPYSRFKEVNDERVQWAGRASAAEQAAQLHQQSLQQTQQRLAQLESQLQARANQTSRTPEQEQERQAALKVLAELQSDDPNYARMQKLAQAAPALVQEIMALREGYGRLEQQTARTFISGEQGRLPQMAAAAGLTLTAQQGAAFENFVAGIIRSDPKAHAAFVGGDQAVLPWAFDIARQQYAAQQQAARASVAQTKSRMPPPRIGGSTPGSTPIPKYDPKDHRGSMAKIHAGAAAAWEQMTG
jgi:hypothetical protein